MVKVVKLYVKMRYLYSGVSGEAHNKSGHGVHTQKNIQNRPCQCKSNTCYKNTETKKGLQTKDIENACKTDLVLNND